MDDIYLKRKLFDNKTEEKHFKQMLEEINSSEPSMIEIGAYWAYWTILFKKKFKNNKTVIIEPDEKHLDEGLHNLKENNMSSIYYKNTVLKNHLETQVPFDQNKAKDIDILEVINKHFNHIDILHSDAQGIEYELLIRLKDLIKTNKIKNLFLLTHSPKIHSDIKEEANKLNLEIKAEIPWKKDDGLLWLKNN